MRRRLRRSWPSLSHHFGIHPWDVDRLTYGELDAYLDELAAIAKRAQNANRPSRRRR